MNKALRIVDCCASCEFWKGYPEDMFCDKTGDLAGSLEYVAPYNLCTEYQRHPEVKEGWLR